YILVSGNLPPFVVIHRMVSGIDSFPLLAVPFFILAGNLMNNAGITTRIFNFALSLVGWLRGGLGHVNVLASVIFAGMSGTAIADAAGLGTIEIKAMKEHGYSTEFAVGVTAASATLGPIIPPSLPFVIYGMMANASVGALFLAGILPGLLLTILMMATVSWYAWKNGWGGDVKFSKTRFFKALMELAVVVAWPLLLWLLVAKAGAPAQITVFVGLGLLFVLDRIFHFEALLPIMTPVLLIGGMTTGLFTPTEGAIAACVWAMILGLAWYRTLSWKMFVKVCLDTVETTSTVLFIVAAASIFGWMLTATGVTADIAAWVLGFTQEAWVFLLLANLLMLFVGCFLEPTAAITILVPILLPIAVHLGVDPIHFGLVMVLNLMIGLLHPPMGMVLFVLARIAGLSFERTTMAILPWLIPLLLALVVITYVPSIVLWLPRMFY
ncbi:MAG: TRAP transporter large permease, partial [Ramlibacter sp.]